MIRYETESRLFHLSTPTSSYLMHILPSGHVAHLYYGPVLKGDIHLDSLTKQPPFELGSSTPYSPETGAFNLNTSLLELATYGKGDYRTPSVHVLCADGSRVTDFKYDHHDILTNKPVLEGMPHVRSVEDHPLETLVISLVDSITKLQIDLYYTPIPDSNSVVRRSVIKNLGDSSVSLERMMSLNLDMSDADWSLISLDGTWINERQWHEQRLRSGITVIDSKKGVSSADHHPFVALTRQTTDEHHGECIGLALVYSGNFEALAEVSPYQLVRLQMGINSFDFRWTLSSSESFSTPEVIMTYSSEGLNRLSQQFHEVISHHLVSPGWQATGRPILINNWEATYFHFNERKLLSLARQAKSLGIELFVLDDGWFGHRDDDHTSLGDYTVHSKKLPHGLRWLSQRMTRIGLQFGIWVEPEMISIDSDLYRHHPNWVIQLSRRSPSLGRHQLILDLTRDEVQTYIVEQLTALFTSAEISYCKWDMNRNFSDIHSVELSPTEQHGFAHRYVMGLYHVLETITAKFPHILFESCASGGNRFDLGMVYYFPQGWISDNSDAISRLSIQYNTSLIFPLATMGCHVSAVPNHQVLRQTPLTTRFNVAMFGLLGYELDFSSLTSLERRQVKAQTTFYKLHRLLLQFGTFHRLISPIDKEQAAWMVSDPNGHEALLGLYQILQQPNYRPQKLKLKGLKSDSMYQVKVVPQTIDLRQFGDLASRVLPIPLHAKNPLFTLIANHIGYPIEEDTAVLSGAQLMNDGWVPKVQFTGNGTNPSTRVMADFGSRVYYVKEIQA